MRAELPARKSVETSVIEAAYAMRSNAVLPNALSTTSYRPQRHLHDGSSHGAAAPTPKGHLSEYTTGAPRAPTHSSSKSQGSSRQLNDNQTLRRSNKS
jgi:hypothetical protein